jgi:NitT/TauT family transport system substrate-binding protein
LPLFVAVHRGFFKDEGLEIELPRLVPAMAHNALIVGEAHYHGLADSGLRLAARGLPLKAIFYAADRPMYYLVAQKEIRTVPELRGKRIGGSQFGGTSDLSARLALRHYGVEPEKDALLIQIGSEGTRMAALRAGSVAAIIVPVPAVAILKREGFNESHSSGTWSSSPVMATPLPSSASRSIHRKSKESSERSIEDLDMLRKIPKEPPV